ncbi:hypothetical protein [Azospirillum halopraeferens]|uniref:hypothetical protein n=1 Tax=Azospirillum halopraeferens TaxID=34010 RepID=UPI0003FB140C|nr:hypothetical protein [Azospirillum halopraeferens]
MAEDDKPKREAQTVTNERAPDFGPMGAGGGTSGRAGRGMGVGTGDYTDAPPASGGGPRTTDTVGEDTGQTRGPASGRLSDVPPTPHDDRGKRPLRGK